MAKLDFCAKTAELRGMIGDGRHEEARERAIELLRDGYSAKPFLAFVAELLDPPKRGKGAPSRPPRQWLDIGEAFAVLRDEGSTYEFALAEVAERFACSPETARRAVRIYETALEDGRNQE